MKYLQNKARERLAYEELVLLQLLSLEQEAAVQAKHLKLRQKQGYNIEKDDYSVYNNNHFYDLLLPLLPFPLTGCQLKAIGEIHADLDTPNRMIRLLQGDVGSGKTVVSIMGIVKVLESDKQVMVLAPTEVKCIISNL